MTCEIISVASNSNKLPKTGGSEPHMEMLNKGFTVLLHLSLYSFQITTFKLH